MGVTVAFVFPGQGAQYVGMAMRMSEQFAEARAVLDQADEALGFSLTDIMAAGPEDRLRLTYYTQPAILAASIACLAALETQVATRPAYVAGHSLGEYTALVAAGALPLAEAVSLVHLRGQLMDAAVPAGTGAMAAVLGADASDLARLCQVITAELGEPVELANVNCPGQIVVSGTAAAVAQLIARVAEAKARRAIALDVSGPFHCSLMQPAQAKLAERLESTVFGALQCPVIANVSAKPLTNPQDVKEALAQQVASPVLWEATINFLVAAGVDTFVEIGPGTVLSGLIKKTDRSATVLHVEDPDSLMQTVQALEAKGELVH
ncbi:MAG: ACP S-malonyltransferase [Firmicutes bacterium]|nr:ACP S-malonyltransferase [Bacillota bacterium]